MLLTILGERIKLLTLLKGYLKEPDDTLYSVYEKASAANSWFTVDNIRYAVDNILTELLNEEKLRSWAQSYEIPPVREAGIKHVGIIMAGNIPLVGFHDVLSVFMTGHRSVMKLSSRDSILWRHIVDWLCEQNAEAAQYFIIQDQIPACDAYIATGSNNTSRYFESFFQKYPNIIRKNRSSVSVISDEDDLKLLVHDVSAFFGLGCRNVSQVYLPENYDLNKILNAFESRIDLTHHHSYRNNYDYHLAVYLLNRVPLHYNDVVILLENKEVHAPVGSLHYQSYNPAEKDVLLSELLADERIQCISTGDTGLNSAKIVPLGQTQRPGLYQYPDGVDVVRFLMEL